MEELGCRNDLEGTGGNCETDSVGFWEGGAIVIIISREICICKIAILHHHL
jgi:hypothetical protein